MPAQNVSPAPVSTIARTLSSASASSIARSRATAVRRSIALRTSGRSRVTTSTAPSGPARSVRTGARGGSGSEASRSPVTTSAPVDDPHRAVQHVGAREQGQGRVVLVAQQHPVAVGGQHAEDRGLDAAVAGVGPGQRLDDALAVQLGARAARGRAGHHRAQVGEGPLRRGGGVDAQRVLGGVPAQRRRQAVRRRVGAQQRHHRGDGVGAVVVAGAAREGQPAGHAQRPVGVVDRQPEGGRADLHRGGEAGVEVDRAEVVGLHPGVRQRRGAGRGDRGRGGQVGALGDEPLVDRRRAGVHEDPALLRHARGLRRGDAGDDEAGGQVDLQVGAHQLGVGVAHRAVVGGDRGQLVGRAGGGVPGVRVGGGGHREPGPQAGQQAPVLGLVTPGGAAQRRLHQRVGVDRGSQPHCCLGLVVGGPVEPDDPVGGAAVGLPGPVGRLAAGLQRRHGRAGLGAADQHHVGGAVDDLLGRVVDGELAAVAAVRRGLHGSGPLGADQRSDPAGLVGVGPRGARHGVDQVGSGEQVGARAAVRERGAQRVDRQPGRLAGVGEVGVALHDLAHPDDDGGAGVEVAPGRLVAHRLARHPQPAAAREDLAQGAQRVEQRGLDRADGGQPDRPAHRRALEPGVEAHGGAPAVGGDGGPQAQGDAHRAGPRQGEPGLVGPLDLPPGLGRDVHQPDLLGELLARGHPVGALAAPGGVQRQPLVGAGQVGEQVGDLDGVGGDVGLRADVAGQVGGTGRCREVGGVPTGRGQGGGVAAAEQRTPQLGVGDGRADHRRQGAGGGARRAQQPAGRGQRGGGQRWSCRRRRSGGAARVSGEGAPIVAHGAPSRSRSST